MLLEEISAENFNQSVETREWRNLTDMYRDEELLAFYKGRRFNPCT